MRSPLAITDHMQHPPPARTLPPAPLLPLNSSCLILAPKRTLKFLFHYSLFNAHCCLVVDTRLPVTLRAYRAIEGLLLYLSHHLQAAVLLPPPSLSLFSRGPRTLLSPAATPGNYKLVHNNNSQMYPSISLSSLSAVSGVAERLAGVKGQLINGAQFDKSQRLLSSSRAFRAERRTTEINA